MRMVGVTETRFCYYIQCVRRRYIVYPLTHHIAILTSVIKWIKLLRSIFTQVTCWRY